MRTLTWVQGEAGAKAYWVSPNSTMELWDTEKQTVYIKSVDAYGIPSMVALDYTFKDAQKAQEDAKTEKPYNITLDDYKALIERVSALEKRKGKKNESALSDVDE